MPPVLMLDPVAYDEMSEPLRHELTSSYDTTLLWQEPDPDGYLRRYGAKILALVNRSGLTAALLNYLPNLEIIAQTGVGLDGLPVEEIARRNIALTNAGDAVSDDVADIAITLMLCVLREIRIAEAHVRSGRWAVERPRISRSASNRRYGILGMGRIGRAIARRLTGFGGSIAYHSRRPVPGSPHTHVADPIALAESVDCLFVALPGGSQTIGLVEEEVLKALGPRGIIVNVGRGSTVSETALIKALREGWIRGAGLDVVENEPRINPELLLLPNLVVLPHVGSSTREGRDQMHRCCLDNLAAHFAGRPLLTPVLGVR